LNCIVPYFLGGLKTHRAADNSSNDRIGNFGILAPPFAGIAQVKQYAICIGASSVAIEREWKIALLLYIDVLPILR